MLYGKLLCHWLVDRRTMTLRHKVLQEYKKVVNQFLKTSFYGLEENIQKGIDDMYLIIADMIISKAD